MPYMHLPFLIKQFPHGVHHHLPRSLTEAFVKAMNAFSAEIRGEIGPVLESAARVRNTSKREWPNFPSIHVPQPCNRIRQTCVIPDCIGFWDIQAKKIGKACTSREANEMANQIK